MCLEPQGFYLAKPYVAAQTEIHLSIAGEVDSVNNLAAYQNEHKKRWLLADGNP